MSNDTRLALRDRTSPLALGTLPQWLMSLALVVCSVMIVGLLLMVVVQGATSFWPGRVEALSLVSGEEVLGIPVRTQTDEDGRERSLYRVGNRDLGQTPFRWVDESDVAERSMPEDAVLLERLEWGIFIGRIPDTVGDGHPGTWEELDEAVTLGAERRQEAEQLRSNEIAAANRRLGETRHAVAAAELRVSEATESGLGRLSWGLLVAIGLGAGGAMAWLKPCRRGLLGAALAVVAIGAIGLAVFERPRPGPDELAGWYETRIAELAQQHDEISSEYEVLNQRLGELEAADAAYRIEIRSADGRLAPESQSATDTPMRASQVVRAIRPNAMSTGQRFGVYFSRWREFLLDAPREANTEGGVFPVIIGTITVTLLLTVIVVPLGVLAALYIREYATQGLVISVLRVAINNLAGVPSIVYGIFGLGFFCYSMGGFIDGGPEAGMRLPKPAWWIVGLVGASAASTVIFLSPRVKRAAILWVVAAVAVLVLVAASPYFDGFFRVKLLDGSPTFGSSGLLWASLTLALLTLPVVIVSTEEAIAAVPQSLREASYGCGASRWQTVSRVVLPGAMPGVMTGAILAMARGAGEVAPLMVVGAVKLAPELPIEARFPFVFADRSFMHLGFHIYDLGFQSPDSEAARGMVWTTTLLLIILVVTMNLGAILLRGRLRRRLAGGHF